MFVPVHVPHPSKRAKDLGHKMAELIRIYKSEDTQLTFMDIRQALRVAEREVQSEFPGLTGVRLVAILMAGCLAAGLFAFFMIERSGAEAPPMAIIIALAIMVISIFAVVIAKQVRN
ncbi:MAG: hypothetical protein ABIK28_25880 [Planctomycetota bacterium]